MYPLNIIVSFSWRINTFLGFLLLFLLDSHSKAWYLNIVINKLKEYEFISRQSEWYFRKSSFIPIDGSSIFYSLIQK